jgi:hypothetical protein
LILALLSAVIKPLREKSESCRNKGVKGGNSLVPDMVLSESMWLKTPEPKQEAI